MKSNEIKKFLVTVLKLKVTVTTIPGKAHWIRASIKGHHDPARNAYVIPQSFPENFRRVCLKTVYPNSPVGDQASAGNVDSASIAMFPHEWEAAINTFNQSQP